MMMMDVAICKVSGNSNAVAAAGTSHGIGATGNGMSAPANSMPSSMKPSLWHNPDPNTQWSAQEQSLLEDLLSQYASEQMVERYVKIKYQLHDKTIRDIAIRSQWMAKNVNNQMKKKNGKRRKEEHAAARKNKDRKGRSVDMVESSSVVANCFDGPPFAQPSIYMDNDGCISYKAIGGVNGKLLEQNARALDQISANFAAFKTHENFDIFCQVRENILAITNDFSYWPESMKQMPPLPVKLNDEYMNCILSISSLQML